MAKGATLYRFKIELSDIDRAVYESLDFRVAMHPSENEPFMLTRVLAYVLNYENGLVFSPGISDPDQPAISLPGTNGGIAKWIDIGNPSARRLHKASKAAKNLRVYTYKDPHHLKKDLEHETIHRASEIEIYALDPKFLDSLVAVLERDNIWTVTHIDGELVITHLDQSWISPLRSYRLD